MSKNVEDYLREWSVLDGRGNIDGSFVPLGIAMTAIQQVIDGKMEYMGIFTLCKRKKHMLLYLAELGVLN